MKNTKPIGFVNTTNNVFLAKQNKNHKFIKNNKYMNKKEVIYCLDDSEAKGRIAMALYDPSLENIKSGIWFNSAMEGHKSYHKLVRTGYCALDRTTPWWYRRDGKTGVYVAYCYRNLTLLRQNYCQQ
ncbi:hypothetical protein O9992_11940 [Vibrio lentus]|nr:hypothetical protein [Vibrio lentus]